MENNGTKKPDKKDSSKGLVYSIAIYSGASILGPLIFFGLIGWWLDKLFQVKHWFILGGVFVAFIFTNILIWRQASIISRKFKESEKKTGASSKPVKYDDDEDDDEWPSEKKNK